LVQVEVLKLPEGQQGYVETNLKLLSRAKCSPNTLLPTRWLCEAKLRKMPIFEISTL
jgi:hypothetical protein